MLTRVFRGAIVIAGLLATTPAHAQYSHVQIEMVLGGVDGDASAQAVQLRIAQAGDSSLAGMTVVVCDSTGGNPVTICTLPTSMSNGALGARVLLCSSAMLGRLAPFIAPDVMLSTLIPPSYLSAGTLFIDMPGDGMGALWRLSWGGASYHGPGAVEPINDLDGDCNPAYPNALNGANRAVKFLLGSNAPSTTNANDYALELGASQVRNNAGEKATVVSGTTAVAETSWGAIKRRFR